MPGKERRRDRPSRFDRPEDRGVSPIVTSGPDSAGPYGMNKEHDRRGDKDRGRGRERDDRRRDDIDGHEDVRDEKGEFLFE